MANRPRVASVGTNVVSAIVRDNEYSAGYLELLTDFDPALTFFVRGELAAANWSRRRADRLAEILRQYESLPDPDFRTINAFTVIRSAARSLGIGKALGSDAWILAQTAALESRSSHTMGMQLNCRMSRDRVSQIVSTTGRYELVSEGMGSNRRKLNPKLTTTPPAIVRGGSPKSGGDG